MTDLRKAAEMALEALDSVPDWDCTYSIGKAKEALSKALAQTEKPPVKSYCGGKPNYCTPEVTPEVTGEVLAQPEQKPVAKYTVDVKCGRCGATDAYNLTIDTAPPKRAWVGLTRRELDIATLGLEDLGDCYKAIEAKLKEKNT